MYGIGFVCVALVSIISLLREWVRSRRSLQPGVGVRTSLNPEGVPSDRKSVGSLKPTIAFAAIASCIFAACLLFSFLSHSRGSNPPRQLSIAGIQLEFPSEDDILVALDRLHATESGADLLMLSEYTLDGPVPEKIKLWCRDHHRYLLVGGKAPAPHKNFYDTAYVVGPDGTIVFEQVKSVPIQFFNDGLPAPEQKLWDSPWGKLGICVCYDLSYTRVTDRLVRPGAQAILVPTMDVIDWGRWEHVLHARVAPVRAAEYGIPIARVASSGISQIVDREGHTLAVAPFPGQNEIIRATISLSTAGSLPLDRFLAPACVALGLLLILVLAFLRFFKRPHLPYSACSVSPQGTDTSPSPVATVLTCIIACRCRLISSFRVQGSSFRR